MSFVFLLTFVFSYHPVDSFAYNKAQTIKDSNKNGLPDSWDEKYGLSGKNIANVDTDKDGLTNKQEFQLKDNPLVADSDHDGVNDRNEDNNNNGIIDSQDNDNGEITTDSSISK